MLPIFQQPKLPQTQGRRDLYVETWGLTVDHVLPANFISYRPGIYEGSRGVRLFSRGEVKLCITKPGETSMERGLHSHLKNQFYPGGDPLRLGQL